MSFARTAITVVLLGMLSACDSVLGKSNSVLEGRWTPVSANDCSRNGIVVVLNESLFAIRGPGTVRAVGRVEKVTSAGAQTLDLDYRQLIRSPTGEDALENRILTIRFKIHDEDRVEAVSGSSDGQAFKPLSATVKEALDLRRCKRFGR